MAHELYLKTYRCPIIQSSGSSGRPRLRSALSGRAYPAPKAGDRHSRPAQHRWRRLARRTCGRPGRRPGVVLAAGFPVEAPAWREEIVERLLFQGRDLSQHLKGLGSGGLIPHERNFPGAYGFNQAPGAAAGIECRRYENVRVQDHSQCHSPFLSIHNSTFICLD
jgi:hypothetical protein